MKLLDKTFKTLVFLAFLFCLGFLCTRIETKFILIGFPSAIIAWAILYFGFYLLLSPLDFFTTSPAMLYLTRVIGTPIAVLWFAFLATAAISGAQKSPSAVSKITLAASPTPVEESATTKPASMPSTQMCRVTGVRGNDFLNIRSGPATKFAATGRLTSDARNIRILGEPVMNGPDKWVRITDGSQEGWVMGKFLAPDSATQNFAAY